MTLPISSLANMEFALYGGASGNMNCPSYINGYRAGNLSSSYNPYMYSMANQNSWRPNQAQNINQGISQNTNPVSNSVGDVTKGSNIDILTDYYAKNLEPSESLASAVIMGGVSGALMMNPRYIAHPINSFKGLKDVKEMFKSVKVDGSDLNKLWKENPTVMQDAYFRMHKAASRANSKLGLFRKRYSDTEYKELKKIMQEALDSKDIQKIAEASKKLENAYISNGHIPSLFKKIRGKEVTTVAEKIADNTGIKEGAEALIKKNSMSYLSRFKHSLGGRMAILFAGVEMLMNIGKIKTAFNHDKENPNGEKLGMKQLGQTTVKAVGNTLGWAAGEAAGIWAATKLGASIGTAFGPGVGTVIGGVAGLIGGSIGMWLAGKATKSIVGEDVANKVEAKKLAQTPEGKAQLLTLVAEKAQKNEEVPQNVMFAAQNVAATLA